MLSFIARVLSAANAPCSFVGCTRRRHVGPCNCESHVVKAAAPREVASIAIIVGPISQVMPVGARKAA